jgi:hypothetical protein
MIVLARQQHRVLELLQIGSELADLPGEIAADVFALAPELEQRLDVGSGGGDFVRLADSLTQAFSLLEDFLTLRLIVPEIRRGDLLFELA